MSARSSHERRERSHGCECAPFLHHYRLTQNGVDTRRFVLGPSAVGGLGVFTAVPVPAGSAVLSVPRSLAMRVSTAWTSPVVGPLLRAASARGAPVQADLALAALVHYERFYNPRSFWAPYFAVLPSAFPHLPLYFSDAERSLLRATSVARQRVDSLLELYDRIMSRLGEEVLAHAPETYGDRATAAGRWEAELKWTVACIATRMFAPRFEQDEAALVPLADM